MKNALITVILLIVPCYSQAGDPTEINPLPPHVTSQPLEINGANSTPNCPIMIFTRSDNSEVWVDCHAIAYVPPIAPPVTSPGLPPTKLDQWKSEPPSYIFEKGSSPPATNQLNCGGPGYPCSDSRSPK